MIECCHRKAVRLRVGEDVACALFNVGDRWEMQEFITSPFEVAPTEEFFIDYNLPCNDDGEGEWGKVRTLYQTEYDKYEKLFNKLFNYRLRCYPDDFRLVEYCWYDCSEAPDYFDESTYHDDFYDEV